MPNRKHKIKDLIVRDPHLGLVTNYGKLMVGYVNGIPCLAHREVLLLLGIKLGNCKQPASFFNWLQLRIPLAGCYLTVYAVNSHQFDELGKQLSRRGYDAKAYTGHPHHAEPKKVFAGGFLVEDNYPIAQPVEIDPFKYHGRGALQMTGKGTPFVRTSKPRKLWLLIKRLFTRGGLNVNS